MWVFGYGSLMWDGWEARWSCLRQSVATLHGYSRAFNKPSVRNWGSSAAPCPTLNVEKHEGGVCVGVAFQFSDDLREAVLGYLGRREGEGFSFPKLDVLLEDGIQKEAYVAVYEGKDLIQMGGSGEKAALARCAVGRRGSCVDYVRGVAERLAELGIEDSAVIEFWQQVRTDNGYAGEIAARKDA
jgi:glutathione-specific gamma-glutamylcyclotransferase